MGCLLSFVLLHVCPLAKHLVHVEVVIAQNGAEGVEEETWGNIFCSYIFFNRQNIVKRKESYLNNKIIYVNLSSIGPC